MSEKTVFNNAEWHLVQTKPRQEFRALQQLQNQSFTCFLPTMLIEKVIHGKLTSCTEPLFSRYMFIYLSQDAHNWSSIRSTRGVSKLVAFGDRFATLPDICIEALQCAQHAAPKRLFEPGDRIIVTHGPFAGLDGIYQMPDGEERALVLIELMNQPQKLKFAVNMLCKAA